MRVERATLALLRRLDEKDGLPKRGRRLVIDHTVSKLGVKRTYHIAITLQQNSETNEGGVR